MDEFHLNISVVTSMERGARPCKIGTATALLQKTLDEENETLDLGIEGVLLKIPSALKIRKPGYPRPRASFSNALYNTSVRKHGLCCARAFRDRRAPRIL